MANLYWPRGAKLLAVDRTITCWFQTISYQLQIKVVWLIEQVGCTSIAFPQRRINTSVRSRRCRTWDWAGDCRYWPNRDDKIYQHEDVRIQLLWNQAIQREKAFDSRDQFLGLSVRRMDRFAGNSWRIEHHRTQMQHWESVYFPSIIPPQQDRWHSTNWRVELPKNCQSVFKLSWLLAWQAQGLSCDQWL